MIDKIELAVWHDNAAGVTLRRHFAITPELGSEARARAIDFFEHKRLAIRYLIPECVYDMSEEEGQTYLDTRKVPASCHMVKISPEHGVTDRDLAMLRDIPELDCLIIRSENLTMEGLKHLSALTKLTYLSISTPHNIEGVFDYLKDLPNVTSFGFSGATGTPAAAFHEFIATRERVNYSSPPTNADPE